MKLTEAQLASMPEWVQEQVLGQAPPKGRHAARKQARTKRVSAVDILAEQLVMRAGLPEPEREIRFAKPRRWAFDLGYSDRKVAIEVEGGVWSRGRHVRPQGYMNDARKYNAAAAKGWTVYRFATEQVKSGEAIQFLIETLCKG